MVSDRRNFFVVGNGYNDFWDNKNTYFAIFLTKLFAESL